jgi:hypothetical protein
LLCLHYERRKAWPPFSREWFSAKESIYLRTVIKRGIIYFVIVQGGILNSRHINPSMSLSLICINTVIDSLLTVHLEH